MHFVFHTVSLGQTGGARSLLNTAQALLERGHLVTVITDRNKLSYTLPKGLVHLHLSNTRLKPGKSQASARATTGDTKAKVYSKQRNAWHYSIKRSQNTLKRAREWLLFPLKKRAIAAYLKQHPADVVASHNMYSNLRHLRYYQGENFYLVIHNSPEEVYLERRLTPLTRVKHYLKDVKVLTVCAELAEEYQALFGASAGPVQVIYNMFDAERIARNAAQAVPAPWATTPYIVAAAQLSARKRLDRLLAAFAKLERTELQLMILGDGKLRSTLQEQARALQIDKRVHWMGFQENPHRYIAAAKALVLTSDSEGFSMVLGEALACGTLPVAVDCPTGSREILTGPLAPFLVPMRGLTEEVIIKGLVEAIERALSAPVVITPEMIEPFLPVTIARQWEGLADG